MKRLTVLCLCLGMFISGCGVHSDENVSDGYFEIEEDVPEFSGLDDGDLPGYVRDTVYANLVDNVDFDKYFVESIDTAYVSKEYLDEIEFNSQSNVFFGFSLDDINREMQGQKYIFTVDESGRSQVELAEELTDKTKEQFLKDVAVGTVVILVMVGVAALTQNPAASITAGKTIKIIYAVSSSSVKAGINYAGISAMVGGLSSGVLTAYQTNDLEKAMKSSVVGMGEGFKMGAIVGTISGGVEGFSDSVKDLDDFEKPKHFKEGTEQAKKYPEGVKFTKNKNGKYYPRFEKYAIDKVKFDKPTLKGAKEHTTLCGNYYHDQKLANSWTGRKYTPEGYVWHHCEDMQTMILVPQDVHSVAKGGEWHDGGAALIKKYLEGLK